MGVISCIVDYYRDLRAWKKLEKAFANGNYESALKANQQLYESCFQIYSERESQNKNTNLAKWLLNFFLWQAETIRWRDCPFMKLNNQEK